MTDDERIRILKVALVACGELFAAIRNDWTDPRAECREGRQLIELALSIVETPDQEPTS